MRPKIAKWMREGLLTRFLSKRGTYWRPPGCLIADDAVGLATRDMGEGIGPAIRSGLLAAEAILHDGDYDLRPIPRLSLLPSLCRLFIPRRV